MQQPDDTDPEIAAKRAATFESLPDEMKRDPKVRARFGLGDLVEAIAAPVAKILGIKNCKPCAQRKAWLNSRVTLRR